MADVRGSTPLGSTCEMPSDLRERSSRGHFPCPSVGTPLPTGSGRGPGCRGFTRSWHPLASVPPWSARATLSFIRGGCRSRRWRWRVRSRNCPPRPVRTEWSTSYGVDDAWSGTRVASVAASQTVGSPGGAGTLDAPCSVSNRASKAGSPSAPVRYARATATRAGHGGRPAKAVVSRVISTTATTTGRRRRGPRRKDVHLQLPSRAPRHTHPPAVRPRPRPVSSGVRPGLRGSPQARPGRRPASRRGDGPHR